MPAPVQHRGQRSRGPWKAGAWRPGLEPCLLEFSAVWAQAYSQVRPWSLSPLMSSWWGAMSREPTAMLPSMCSGGGQGCRMVKGAGVGRSE